MSNHKRMKNAVVGRAEQAQAGGGAYLLVLVLHARVLYQSMDRPAWPALC